MNPSLNLYPAKIQAQCACAITQLDEQISALNMLKGSINEFVSDSSIHSVSFNQLKSQCRNYLDVIDAMIYCNEQDKTDFVTLQGSVGNEDLVGAIIDKWERYYKQKLDETRRNYENVKGMVSGYAALQMQAYYANLIQMYQQLYDNWYAKELAYYEIDGKTSTLFAKSYGRQAISNLLSALKDSFKLEEGYNSSVVAAQAIKVKNAMTGSMQMEPEVMAAWDALITSGCGYKNASYKLTRLRTEQPDVLNQIKDVILSRGYSVGVEEARQCVKPKWYGQPMQMSGQSTQEKYMNVHLSAFKKIPWNQNKVDELWSTCEIFYDEYGIEIDPCILLAIIIHEGTGSFNTSSTNLAADGQHGAETNFSVDLMKANSLIFGKTIGYLYFRDDFERCVCDGIEGRGGVFDYMNWKTPIIRPWEGSVKVGVYASDSAWGKNVGINYENLTYEGAIEDYSNYVRSIDDEMVQELVDGVDVPNYEFIVTTNGQDYAGNSDGSRIIETY